MGLWVNQMLEKAYACVIISAGDGDDNGDVSDCHRLIFRRKKKTEEKPEEQLEEKLEEFHESR